MDVKLLALMTLLAVATHTPTSNGESRRINLKSFGSDRLMVRSSLRFLTGDALNVGTCCFDGLDAEASDIWLVCNDYVGLFLFFISGFSLY